MSRPGQGFVYVAFIIDVFARRIVGWRVSRTAHAALSWMLSKQALHARRPISGSGLVTSFGSRKPIYCPFKKYTERSCPKQGLEAFPSAGVGDSYDNALAETNQMVCYKAEVHPSKATGGSQWTPSSIATLIWWIGSTTADCLGPIGHIPPAEAEAKNYYAGAEGNRYPLHDPNQIASGVTGARFTASLTAILQKTLVNTNPSDSIKIRSLYQSSSKNRVYQRPANLGVPSNGGLRGRPFFMGVG